MSDAPTNLAAVREGRASLARLVAEYPALTSTEARTRLADHLASEALTDGTTVDTIGDMSPPAPERRAVNLRVDPALMEMILEAEVNIPALSRHAICLAALHIGLPALIDNPTLALEQNVRGRAEPGKPAKKRGKRPSK